MKTCPKCGRPEANPEHGWCECMTSWERIFAAAAYRRGLLAGVELVHRVVSADYATLTSIEWDEVNEEAAKLAGEGT